MRSANVECYLIDAHQMHKTDRVNFVYVFRESNIPFEELFSFSRFTSTAATFICVTWMPFVFKNCFCEEIDAENDANKNQVKAKLNESNEFIYLKYFFIVRRFFFFSSFQPIFNCSIAVAVRGMHVGTCMDEFLYLRKNEHTMRRANEKSSLRSELYSDVYFHRSNHRLNCKYHWYRYITPNMESTKGKTEMLRVCTFALAAAIQKQYGTHCSAQHRTAIERATEHSMSRRRTITTTKNEKRYAHSMCRRDRNTNFCSARRISPHSCVSGTRFERRPRRRHFHLWMRWCRLRFHMYSYILQRTLTSATNGARMVLRWNYIAWANHMWAIQIRRCDICDVEHKHSTAFWIVFFFSSFFSWILNA